MARRKMDSKRRWKARCRLGLAIPLDAIENFRLTRWFSFVKRDHLTHYYWAQKS